jgi:hypothetical protein
MVRTIIFFGLDRVGIGGRIAHPLVSEVDGFFDGDPATTCDDPQRFVALDLAAKTRGTSA